MTTAPLAPPAVPPLLEYPGRYQFKVMGPAADDFAEHVRRVVGRFVTETPADSVSVRTSSEGKYQSVSVDVLLESEDQRRAVYLALHEDPRVVYCL